MAEELPQLCLQLPNLLEAVRTLGLPTLALSLPFLALSRQLLRQLLVAGDALVSSHALARCISSVVGLFSRMTWQVAGEMH